MKGILLIFVMFLALGLDAKVVVISDIDDTIKTANSAGTPIGQAWHFLRKRIYPVSRDLYQELHEYYQFQGEEVEFHYVSAAPDILFDQIRWLNKNDFPIGPTYLRQFDSGDTRSFKMRTIKEILEGQDNLSEVRVFFFGDNASHDPEVYRTLKEEMGLDAEIFIRDVSTEATSFGDLETNRLEGINYFFSEKEFELFPSLAFMSEELLRRLSERYHSLSLIPPYTRQVLRRRLLKLKNCEWSLRCAKEASNESKKYFLEYYQRY